MIYFDRISKVYYPSVVALKDVTLSIAPGEFLSIVGQSGAGKTTLLKLLLAEEKPTSGKVFFESLDVHSLPRNKLYKLRRRVGMVFQDFLLLSSKTVYENIAFVMQVAGKTDEEIEREVPQVLEVVNLADKSFYFPHELSGGERQRVAIARALVNRPDLVIADEPTGNLDPLNIQEIIELFKKINELGTTVILATHNRDLVNYLNHRVVTLEKGEITRDNKKGKYII
jgi:cell division transport system ATP-binding protein